MIPTPKLRFIERPVVIGYDGGGAIAKSVRILQQLWIPDNDTYEEWLKNKDGVWRDVPLEKE